MMYQMLLLVDENERVIEKIFISVSFGYEPLPRLEAWNTVQETKLSVDPSKLSYLGYRPELSARRNHIPDQTIKELSIIRPNIQQQP